MAGGGVAFNIKPAVCLSPSSRSNTGLKRNSLAACWVLKPSNWRSKASLLLTKPRQLPIRLQAFPLFYSRKFPLSALSLRKSARHTPISASARPARSSIPQNYEKKKKTTAGHIYRGIYRDHPPLQTYILNQRGLKK